LSLVAKSTTVAVVSICFGVPALFSRQVGRMAQRWRDHQSVSGFIEN